MHAVFLNVETVHKKRVRKRIAGRSTVRGHCYCRVRKAAWKGGFQGTVPPDIIQRSRGRQNVVWPNLGIGEKCRSGERAGSSGARPGASPTVRTAIVVIDDFQPRFSIENTFSYCSGRSTTVDRVRY